MVLEGKTLDEDANSGNFKISQPKMIAYEDLILTLTIPAWRAADVLNCLAWKNKSNIQALSL